MNVIISLVAVMALFLLGMVYREVKQALTNMERLFGLLDERQDVQDRPDAVELETQRPEVSFEDVVFGYDDRRRILHGVDFVIPPGGTVAVVGHSGAGKSTLTRLLYRFYDVDGGRILVDGCDIRDYTQGSLRGAIAIVPQDTVLFNDTIYYNIHYGKTEATRDEVEAAARAAHIHEFIMSMPDGYETEVGERGLKLSGGEKQRVAIARAFATEPAVLFADEPTGNLDTRTGETIMELMFELNRKSSTTLILVTHDNSLAARCDRVLSLDAGKLVGDTPAAA